MDKSAPASVHLPVVAYAYATMSCVQLEWNQVELALSNARQGVVEAEQWNQADTLHYTLICLSHALAAAGNLEEALSINHRSMQLAVTVSSWFYHISCCDEIGFNLRKGDIASAAHKFQEINLLLEESNSNSGFLMAKVNLLYAQERYSDVLLALEKPISQFELAGDSWYLIHLLPFQALALEALGKQEKALGILGHCLALAKPEGFVRAFVQRGAPMARLLQAALNLGIESDTINKLLPAFNISVADHKAEPSGLPKIQPVLQSNDLVEPLSKREIQILHLLATPLTTPEIARELHLSSHTIRTHVRNIYGKLGVNRRLGAVQRAEELKIL